MMVSKFDNFGVEEMDKVLFFSFLTLYTHKTGKQTLAKPE